jgi:phthiocerol/phenolphthiocerol synthesis type-I polyketide synthase C
MPAEHVMEDANGQVAVTGQVRRQLLAVEPGRRRTAIMLRHLTGLVAQFTGEPPAAIDPDAPLTTLGLNSARILELLAKCEDSLQVTLPATLAWQFPTLAALAPYVAKRMGIDLEAPAAGPAPVTARAGARGAPPDGDPRAYARDTALEELSDADLAALLLMKIEQMGDALQP